MITDLTAVEFSNRLIRTGADKESQLYYRAKSTLDEYKAKGLDKLFIDNEIVDDGAGTRDSRTPITGLDVKTVIDLLQQYVDDFESGLNAKLNSVLKVAVNPTQNV